MRFLGDANGLDESEFFRKQPQPSSHLNKQNSSLDVDSKLSRNSPVPFSKSLSLATILRKEHNISRPIGDDPFALDGFGDCKFED